MILYEYEGKELLRAYGIAVPHSVLLDIESVHGDVPVPAVVKAQVAQGHRASHGGIVRVDDSSAVRSAAERILTSSIGGERPKHVLVEEFVPHNAEHYLALTYDPGRRAPVILHSDSGGTGVESRTQNVYPIRPTDYEVPAIPGLPDSLIRTLIELFLHEDLLLLEINPLVETPEGWVALDAKVHVDDSALFRHPNQPTEARTPGHEPSARETEARAIDRNDHRGTAGASYIEMDGDIAILASGGGASMLALDALVAAGGRPANYVEYSGNPPREKVEALARVVLSKPNLKGLWIVGAVANFTDIYETLTGVMSGIAHAESALGTRFDFPIVIRRGGPRDDEAFAYLRSLNDARLTLLEPSTTIPSSARIMVEKAYGSQPTI
jgi:succinyl-CoA synthetase beta subunit